MGNTIAPTKTEQQDAYTEYVLMGAKRTLRTKIQAMLAAREEELEQAGKNAGPAMEFGYLGYRMALEDLYYRLYDENLPEVKSKTTIDWSSVDV